jgi:cobalt/nickel transport system permease protein
LELFTEHFKKNHRLTKVDARLKIIVGMALLIMVLSYKGLVFPLVLTGLCFILCMRLRIPARVFLLRFSEPAVFILIILLIKIFFTGKDALFSFRLFGFPVAAHGDGLWDGLMIAARILGAVSVAALLGFITAFSDFLAGLSWFKVPKGFVEILMFAYRFVFIIFQESLVIYHAQKNRLGYAGVGRSLNSFGILTGSLILKAFDHSQATTVAMVQRGYDGSLPQLKPMPFKASEIAGCLLIIFAAGVLWKI